jgi:hypothetical protein
VSQLTNTTTLLVWKVRLLHTQQPLQCESDYWVITPFRLSLPLLKFLPERLPQHW